MFYTVQGIFCFFFSFASLKPSSFIILIDVISTRPNKFPRYDTKKSDGERRLFHLELPYLQPIGGFNWNVSFLKPKQYLPLNSQDLERRKI